MFSLADANRRQVFVVQRRVQLEQRKRAKVVLGVERGVQDAKVFLSEAVAGLDCVFFNSAYGEDGVLWPFYEYYIINYLIRNPISI